MTQSQTVFQAILFGVVVTIGSPGAANAGCGDGVLESSEQCDDGNGADGDCCSSACMAVAEGASCDDGRPCTTSDACRAGACGGTPEDALCGLELPPFLCFTARAGRAPRGDPAYPSFEARRGERVVDEYATNDPNDRYALDLKRSVGFCADASGAALAGASHLHSYDARRAKMRPRQPRFTRRTIAVETAIGALRLVIRRPHRLLVPANAASGEDAPADSTRRHRRAKCYAASAKVPLPPVIAVTDPIHATARRLRPLRLSRLCAQEIRGTADAPSPRTGYLACFKAKLAKETPRQPKPDEVLVTTRTDFGSEVLEVRRITEVCVPAVAMAPDTTPEPPPFAFLTGSSAVDVAMRTVWENGQRAPQSTEAATAAAESVAQAAEVLRQNVADARARLAVEVCAADPGDLHGLVSLHPLLRLLADDPSILGCLRDLALAAPQAPAVASLPHPTDDDDTPDGAYVRTFAASQIAQAARTESTPARDLLLNVAESTDPAVVRVAVRAYYGLVPNRRLAQRTLRARIRAEHRHVLYVE